MLQLVGTNTAAKYYNSGICMCRYMEHYEGRNDFLSCYLFPCYIFGALPVFLQMQELRVVNVGTTAVLRIADRDMGWRRMGQLPATTLHPSA